MSNLENEKWLEAAFENFMSALDSGDYEMCKAVIGDVAEKGFTRESELLQAKLNAMPAGHFNILSPIQLDDEE